MKKQHISGYPIIYKTLRVLLLLLFFAAIIVSTNNQAAALQNGSLTNGNLINLVNNEERERIVFTDGVQQYPYTLAELSLVRMGDTEQDGLSYYFISCADHAQLSYKLFLLSKKINKPPVDARFYFDEQETIHIEQEQEGKELDLGSLITSLGNPGFYLETYPLPIKRVPPRITAEDLAGKTPKYLWSEYKTVLANIPDRTENVRVASHKLNGFIIEPGAEVSFNDVVGPREPEQGYRAAKVIVGGKFEPGMGGGVCQVSSTFYNTILQAGLKIKERYNHSVRIAYVPLGRDATVVYGQKDLKFINTSDSYLLIRTELSGLNLSISLYGSDPKPFDQIELVTKVLKTIPCKEQYISDSFLAPGEKKLIEKGGKGYITKTYRVISADGNKTTELISEDYYHSSPTIIAQGPKLNEEY